MLNVWFAYVIAPLWEPITAAGLVLAKFYTREDKDWPLTIALWIFFIALGVCVVAFPIGLVMMFLAAARRDAIEEEMWKRHHGHRP